MLASFSICGALKIDLAMVPREAYPFVILAIGLENMWVSPKYLRICPNSDLL